MGEGARDAAGLERPGAGGSTEAQSGRLRVFISYSRDDIDFADQLEAGLTVTGFDVAMDRHGITAGEDFQRRLGALIREADTVVFVLSPSSARSQMCAWEVDEAMRLGKRIIPVVCCGLEGNEPPPHLKSLDYVFFYAEPKVAGSGFGHGLARLVAALNTDLDWMREHTRLLARATEWETAGRVENRMLSGADIAAAKEWASKRPKGAPEPTALHLDYIRASEDVEHARTNAERKRLAEMAAAQAEREEALKKAEVAQQEKAQASRRLVQRTMAGMVVALVLAIAASGAGLVAWRNQKLAVAERQRAENNLSAINEALTVFDNQSKPEDVAQSFFRLAHTYLSQQRVQDAIKLYQRSLAILEKQPGSADSAEIAAVRSQLGVVFTKVDNKQEAEPLLKDALDYYERSRNTSHPNVSTILATLADIYKSQARTAEAADIAEKARLIAISSEASLVPVYYATDRAPVSGDGRQNFGFNRGRALQIGKALVSIPKVHELSSIERPWRLRVPYFDYDIYAQNEDPRLHFTIERLSPLATPEFMSGVKERLAASTTFNGKAFVFVNGYNTSFDNAVYRAAQLAYSMNFDGAVFVYSWPSGGDVASYTYDRESSQASAPYLKEFLQHLHDAGATSISILAHSMGCLPVLEALENVARSSPPGLTIDQLILAAPDVDSNSFQHLAPSLTKVAKGITLYAASNDRALLISQNFWGNYRAGDVPPNGPLIVAGVDTIDVTNASASDNALLSDMRALIANGTRPPDKRSPHFLAVDGSSGRYWRYEPPSP